MAESNHGEILEEEEEEVGRRRHFPSPGCESSDAQQSECP